jgi:hypothetical protein
MLKRTANVTRESNEKDLDIDVKIILKHFNKRTLEFVLHIRYKVGTEILKIADYVSFFRISNLHSCAVFLHCAISRTKQISTRLTA